MAADRADDKVDSSAVLGNIKETVQTSIEILSHFYSLLLQGGFSNGAESYRKMSDILIGQKIWSTSFSDKELKTQFDELAKLASKIYSLLTPYTNAMNKLQALTSIDSSISNQRENMDLHIEDKILRMLRKRVRPMSLDSLMVEIEAEAPNIVSVLDKMTKEGSVIIKMVSGRKHFKADIK